MRQLFFNHFIKIWYKNARTFFMDIMQKTAIVVPCYNEDHRLDTQQFLEYTRENINVSFIFVDDGSSDNTHSIIQNLESKSRQIMTVFLDKNCGKGEAVRQGFLKAQKLLLL